MGRFISSDPIEFQAGDFNFYRYVGNDPVNFVDPSGHKGFEVLEKIQDALDMKDAMNTLGDIFEGVTRNDLKECRAKADKKYPFNVDGNIDIDALRNGEYELCYREFVNGESKDGLKIIREKMQDLSDTVETYKKEAKEATEKYKKTENNNTTQETSTPSSENSSSEICDGLEDAGVNHDSDDSDLIQANENLRDCAIENYF